jgi:hypothetical protein
VADHRAVPGGESVVTRPDNVEELERRSLAVISAITVLSGALQVATPATVLRPLGAKPTKTTRQLFGTIGMFMVCFGATLLDATVRESREPGVVLWAAAQKAGAAGAVGLGVRRGVFSPVALTVAGFDALSGAVAFDYWRRLRS